MTIRTRLYMTTAIMVAGLAIVTLLSIFAMGSIRRSINLLTAHSTPLQIKTTELQKQIETLSGGLMQLGVTRDPQEVRRLSAAIDAQKEAIERIVEEVGRLDTAQKDGIDISTFKGLHATVLKAVEERLANIARFKADAGRVDASFREVERLLAGIRKEMLSLTGAGSARVTDAVRSSTHLFGATSSVKDMMLSLREINVLLNDLELSKGRTEVLALKQKMKMINTAIQGTQVDDPVVKEVKEQVAAVHDKFVRPGDGLIAFKQDILAGKGQESRFQSLKKGIQSSLTDLNFKLSALTDTFEVRVGRNRGEVDQALGERQRIAAITDSVSSVVTEMKSLDSKVRVLMLSDTEEGFTRAVAEIRAVQARLDGGIAAIRRDMLHLRQKGTGTGLDGAARSLRQAGESINRIIEAQKEIIASNTLVAGTIDTVKRETSREVEAGAARVRRTSSSQEEMVAKVNGMVKRMSTLMVLISAAVALLALITSLAAVTRIGTSLRRMVAMLQDIAEGEGDLSKRLAAGAKDELGEAARWFNIFLDKLCRTMNSVADHTGHLAAASESLNATSGRIATGAEKVAMQAMTVSTASEEMAATSGEIAKNCQTAVADAGEAGQAAREGAAVVEGTIRVMNGIADQVRASAATVTTLGSRSDQIGSIIRTIEEIADQTNLLALNAAIEAARAGEQGLGFAVVADEVRRLAERTTSATQEIGVMIRAIQEETGVAVVSMQQGMQQVESGTAEAARSGEALRQILERIGAVTMQVNQIAVAAEQQTATTREISATIHQVTEVVRETADAAQDSAGAAERLAALSGDLRRLVGQFKLT